MLGTLLVVAAALAAISLNLLLLERTAKQGDPVGGPTPRGQLPAAPVWTMRPARGPIEDGGADD